MSTTSSSTTTDPSETIRQGSCLCKSVQFQVKGEPVHYLLCHCKNCQKASGGGFMMNVWFKDENFTIKAGKELIKVFYDPNTDTGKPLGRYFCSNCGSNVYFRMSPELARSDIYIVQGPTIEGSEVWFPRKESHPENKLQFVGHIETRAKEKKSKL
ncbi:hypothetical protein GYMLUDRAFT_42124 [Collybiopsis luxurians FD-317 M1]|uniref:CENP-V/GFA domain-containing protein n=1 Tax=Collybiopsis luxurians FD-317 M1 TaxID=944289 RepID=A0A0D0CZS8_9AGAR|nr:hypothetical protein GYMLUDRAFT_42124 [Collybiopsis luxurians FD-317 M1]